MPLIQLRMFSSPQDVHLCGLLSRSGNTISLCRASLGDMLGSKAFKERNFKLDAKTLVNKTGQVCLYLSWCQMLRYSVNSGLWSKHFRRTVVSRSKAIPTCHNPFYTVWIINRGVHYHTVYTVVCIYLDVDRAVCGQNSGSKKWSR